MTRRAGLPQRVIRCALRASCQNRSLRHIGTLKAESSKFEDGSYVQISSKFYFRIQQGVTELHAKFRRIL